ncbi:MAG: biotin--[acetyl-CoA-carboxylase] ligase [Alkalicoccus sp.]|nr:MAG: biotin--[acetyl-CoA-carboxylase] ligase [Alkalicoccus sp.]
MKSKLLAVLKENYPEYVSGEKLSGELSCSRTAVWKHIEKMRKEGYIIKAVRNRGYLLESSPEAFSAHAVASQLSDALLPYKINFYRELPSTQPEAQRLFLEGAGEGTVVIADSQTSGRGRLGREWQSGEGKGLAMSIILTPGIPPYKAPQLTLAAAVSIVKAVNKMTGIDMEIKWPNDLLVDGRKVCGILTEMQSDPDQVRSVIVGIGLNVKKDNFSGGLENTAVTLEEAAGREVDRADVAAAILMQFASDYKLFLDKGFKGLKKDWETHTCTLGRFVRVEQNGVYFTGKAESVDDQGVLQVRTEDGILHPVVSGDIELS